jgi:hypothetical protein
MSISATTNRVSQNGNGSTTDFSFPYPIHAAADLVVISTIIATGVQTTKTLTTHYTISGSADSLGHYPNGVTVTMLTAPASTERLTIYRDPALTQSVDLVENDPLPVEAAVEAPLDRLTMICQRFRDVDSRSLRQPEGDADAIDYLPAKVTRASLYLGFDSDGDPVALDAPAGTTAVSVFAATILDDTTAAAARATQKILVHAVLTKTATYAVVAADDGKLIDCTSGTFDVDLLAAATAGAGFAIAVKNSGTGIITVDPDSSELIDGISGLVLLPDDEVLVVSDGSAWKSFARFQNAVPIVNDFRLSLTTGLPVTTADVTAAGTLYAVPKTGNRISLYNGAKWIPYTSAEFSLALTLTSGKPYDVFCYQNAGVPTLEVLVWTNDTTRATALAYQDGVLIKSGDATRRYLGTLYASGANTTEDSETKRYLWNYYHRVTRNTKAAFTAARTTTSGTVVEINTEIRNQFVLGVAEDAVQMYSIGTLQNSGASDTYSGIGVDGTTVEAGATRINNGATDAEIFSFHSYRVKILAAGFHYVTVLGATGGGTTGTWAGDASNELLRCTLACTLRG